jgi:parallel beta-helix repeat protein
MKSNVFVAIRGARVGLTLAALSITLLWASPAKAGTACGVIISQPGVYALGTNVGPCASGVDGIDIEASNVTLLLNGHTISGATSVSGNCNASIGIHVLGTSSVPLSGVNVVGPGTISNFWVGFGAYYSAGSSVSLTTVKAPQCPGTYTLTLDGSTFTESTSFGFIIDVTSNHWTLLRNVVREPGVSSEGIYVLGPVEGFPPFGPASGSYNNVIENNVNDTIGFEGSTNNNIIGNIANDNYGGIELVVASNNNNVLANTTNGNAAGDGILVSDYGTGLYSTGNNIIGNTSLGNSPWDMEDDEAGGGCASNIWEGNHFKTANQACIIAPSLEDDSHLLQ